MEHDLEIEVAGEVRPVVGTLDEVVGSALILIFLISPRCSRAPSMGSGLRFREGNRSGGIAPS